MAATDVIRLADCPTCRQPRHTVAMCTCGDSIIEHLLGIRRGLTARTQCSRYGCGCVLYEEAAG